MDNYKLNQILNNPDITKITIEKIVKNSYHSKSNYYDVKNNEDGYVKKLLNHLIENMISDNVELIRIELYKNEDNISFYKFDVIYDSTDYIKDSNIDEFLNIEEFKEIIKPITNETNIFKNLYHKFIIFIMMILIK